MPINNFITSLYGDRLHPIHKEKKFHNGVDINGYKGQVIYCVLNGVITEKYYNETYGNVLVYEGNINNRSIKIFMAHLDESLVEIGEKVETGQKIAIVGDSGITTGVHLHLSIYVDDKLINPLYVLTDKYY